MRPSTILAPRRLALAAIALATAAAARPARAQPDAPAEDAPPASEPAEVRPPTLRPGEKPEFFTKPPDRAQQLLLSVSWDLASPVGTLRRTFDTVSLNGFQLEGRYFLADQFSLGLNVSWNGLYKDQPRRTYPLEDGAVTATLHQRGEFFTVRALAHAYLGPAGPLLPYLGLGVGPASVYFETLVSDLSRDRQRWMLSVSPEVGVLIPFRERRRTAGITLNVRYTVDTATFRDARETQYVSAQIGLFGLQ